MQIGDAVIKGGDVLRIVGRKSEAIGDNPEQDYWVLEKAYPTGRSGYRLHVPITRESEMLRPVPSQEDWGNLIKKVVEGDRIMWIKDRSKRMEQYHAIVFSGDLVSVMQLGRTYLEHRKVDESPLSSRDRDFESKAHEFVAAAAAASFDVTPEKATQMLEHAMS